MSRTAVVGRAVGAIGNADPLDLVPRLSLLLVVLNTNDDPPLFVLSIAVCAVALRQKRLYRSPWLWIGLAVVIGARQLSHWEGIDDHVVVTTYWALALGLSLLAPDPAAALAANGRRIIGLVFGFAVLWKLFSPDFVSGDFFRYTLLLDDRFGRLARGIAGLSGADYRSNFAAVAALRAGRAGTAVALAETGTIPTLARLMTYWGLLVESVVAASLLFPLRGRARWARHAGLFAFCLTTYLVVPIGGFGCLLAVLGVSLSGDHPAEAGPRLRVAYVVLFAALVVYAPFWRVLLGP